MAKGILAVRARIVATVAAVVPSVWSDKLFQCMDDGHARVKRLQDWDRVRGFEVDFTDDRMPYPRQDLLPCGRTGHYMTAEITVWIRYDTKGSRSERLNAMATDASLVGGALLNPTDWDESNSGIYHIEVLKPDEPERVYAREVDEDLDAMSHEADVVALLVPLNIRVEYEQE